MNNDTINKHDRIGDRIQKKRIKGIRNFFTYAFLGLLIIGFVQNAVEAKAETIIAVAPITVEVEDVKYYAEFEQGSWEIINAYCNQMLGTVYQCK